jgi:chorismate-pyruvate lyase
MTGAGFRAALACGAVLLWSTAGADGSTSAQTRNWSANFVSRLEALALLETLNSELLSNNSATLTLEHWCDVHHLASPPRIVAVRVSDVDNPLSLEQRQELHVTPTEQVRYRRVRLKCGSVVLSEADNWYVPSRLTPEMNKLLDTTDTPFGRAVQALHFQRRTLSAKVLWRPLPDGWEMNAASINAAVVPIPATLLEHRAVLTLPDGPPFSEVVESYTADVLAFPVPQP